MYSSLVVVAIGGGVVAVSVVVNVVPATADGTAGIHELRDKHPHSVHPCEC